MRARLRLTYIMLVLCAGCGTVSPPVRTAGPVESCLPLSDEEISFARALAHYGQGLIYQDRCVPGMPDSANSLTGAVRHFSAAVELDPTNAKLYPTLAVSYLALHQPEKAIEVLKLACDRQPKNIQPRIDLAVAYEKTGRFSDAMTLLNQAISMAPQMDALYRELALLYYQQKQHQDAYNLLKRGMKCATRPEVLASFCHNFGKLYESAAMDSQAIALYKLAGSSSFKWPDPTIRIVAITMKTDMAKALDIAEDAIASLPNEPKLHFLLGILRNNNKDYAKACAAFQKTEKLAEASSNDMDKATLNPIFYMNYGSSYERVGNIRKAEEIFEKCLVLYPESHEILNYLAYMWAERGEKMDQGLKHITRALELDPGNAAYLDTLGWIYYKQHKYDKALEEVRKSDELIKNDPTITEHLGDIYYAMDDKEKAIACWKKSFIMDQNNKALITKLEQNGLTPGAIRKELEDRLKQGPKPPSATDGPPPAPTPAGPAPVPIR